MEYTKIILTVAFLVLLGSASFGQSSDPWAVKKQRNGVVQPISFPYQVRNGATAAGAVNARVASPLRQPLSLNQRLVPTGPAGEPPREIRGTLPAAANGRANLNLPEAAQHYLTEARSLMRIELPEQEFVARQQWKDNQGAQHLRLQQHYQGVPVYGSEIIVHADQATTVQGLNGRYIASPTTLNPVPTVNETDAVATSLARFRREGTLQSLTPEQQRLLNYTKPSAELMILPSWEASKPTLAWRVLVRPNMLDHWEVFIDAHTGQLISRTNLTCTFIPDVAMPNKPAAPAHEHTHRTSVTPTAAPWQETAAGKGSGTDLNGVNRPMETWQDGGFNYLVDATKDMFRGGNVAAIKDLEGVLITYDAERVAKPTSVTVVNAQGTSFSDPAAVSAHYNASLAYDYFRNVHRRNAIDGRGGNVLSIVNFVNDDGSEMDNAFWNGEYMVYGNGDRGFKPLAGGTDVGGHEMSHGVIGSTANLVYRNQSGAINEHIADVFGVLIDAEDYTLGEDVILPEVFPSGAMRDMEDPHNGGESLDDNGWQPDHMRELYTGDEDNGGVHINSGIPNRAFFLIATELGRDKAGAIYYRALTTYLTASSEFIDLRQAVINATTDLEGDAAAQVVAQAFDAVGITEGNTEPGGGDEPGPVPDKDDDDLPAIAGKDLFLTVNTDPDDTNADGTPWTLYFVNDNDGIFEPISTTSVSRKPAVMDDGSLAFFVTEQGTIRGIELTEPYNEMVISDTSLWANLSVSKDGQRLALITNQKVPQIWVLDLTRETDNFTLFELYNPTTQEDIVTYDVQYADALEWDYSGEYLLYDAFNRVGTFGVEADVEYWDVNFIKVWDNTANDFGDGAISKIFSGLPKGTSIGNPSFAKTNRNIVCFDLFNEIDESYLIIATDLGTGETKTVYENNTLGFPNYSNDDRFLIFDELDEDGRPTVSQIRLQDNKLEAAGEPTVLFTEAKWTTWFSQGQRVINSPENELLSFEVMHGESSIPGTITGQRIVVDAPDDADIRSLVANFEQSSGANVYVGEARQISGLTSNDFSKGLTYRVIAENGTPQDYAVTITQNNPNPNPDPEPENPDPNNPDPDGEVVGIEDELAELGAVYPNPFEENLYLKESLANQPVTLTLHNVLGQAVPLVRVNDHFEVASSAKPGLYLLTIQHAQGSETVRLIKR